MAQTTRLETRPDAPVRADAPSFWRSFGPGLLWAAAAIGVSHLVQSTRAGASGGFALVGIIMVALVLKYPFFEYGPRYAAATGASLVEGYRRIGRWAIWLYLAITIATAVIITGTIVLFTSFLLTYVLGVEWPVAAVGAVLYGGCAGLLWFGRFRLLDRTIKVVLVALAISTVIAAGLALPRADLSTLMLWPADGWTAVVPFAFILALVGWMPSAIDISVWSSLWTLAKDDDSGVRASVRTAKLDFLVGYVGTGIMAFAFVILGAAVMHGSGESFSPQGTAFSVQLVDLYALTLGEWARPLVAVAVLTTMFSTSLTVIDGFPRAVARSIRVLRDGAARDPGEPRPARDEDAVYWLSVAVMGALVVLVLAAFVGSLTGMVDFATIISFLTAPVLGYLNLRAVTSPDLAPEHRPGRAMLALSYTGLVLLGGFGFVYLGWLIVA